MAVNEYEWGAYQSYLINPNQARVFLFFQLNQHSLLEGMLMLLKPLPQYLINNCDNMVTNQQTWGLNGNYSRGSTAMVSCFKKFNANSVHWVHSEGYNGRFREKNPDPSVSSNMLGNNGHEWKKMEVQFFGSLLNLSIFSWHFHEINPPFGGTPMAMETTIRYQHGNPPWLARRSRACYWLS